MDHVVYLDAKAKELENLINGNKSMILRGSAGRKVPHGRVNEGDILYFINNYGECKVKARGIVSSVYNSHELSVEESYKTIIMHQDKLQLPDKQFNKFAGNRYLVLIGLDDIQVLKPFPIDRSTLTNMDDWLPVGSIEKVAL